MKILYTFLFCVVASYLFAQDSTKAAVFTSTSSKLKTTKENGFWVAASYGYNTRSLMPDLYQLKSYPGKYAPKAYFAGSMPSIEAGYLFASRLGLYLGFSIPFPIRHEYYVTQEYMSFAIQGHDFAKGWHGSFGAQYYALKRATGIKPYIKAAFNMGSAQINHLYISTGGVNYKYRGGYTLGGTIALGAEYKIYKRLYLSAEAAFTNMVYKPAKMNGLQYNYDLSEGYTPNFPWQGNSQYLLQEYFRMNFISFRVGLRYNFFGN